MECNEEGNGFSGKSNGVESSRQATATKAMATVMAKTWAMAMGTRVAGNKEGNGNIGKSNDDSNEGDGQATAMRLMATAMAMTWAMAMATRLAGNKDGKAKGGKGDGETSMRVANNEEGEGGKGMVAATSVVCKRKAMATKRAMAM